MSRPPALSTKIVATLGAPRSFHRGIVDLDGRPLAEITWPLLVRRFIECGVDVIRFNLAHFPSAEISDTYHRIKTSILANEKRVGLLVDLPGPKIRLKFRERLTVDAGAPFTVRFGGGKEDPGVVYVGDEPLKTAMRPSPFRAMMRNIAGQLAAGEELLVVIGDGGVVLRVERVRDECLECLVVTTDGHSFSGTRGFTLKGIDLEIPSLTVEDKEKLDRILECEYREHEKDDWRSVLSFIALSFTQEAEDILRLEEHVRGTLGSLRYSGREIPPLIAKIESNRGWINRESILDVADGLMVARGDLGLQMEVGKVPAVQKTLIDLSRQRRKIVLTATEMLRSMIESTEPTRAEVSDVFNAIIDGTDVVVLSEETSRGRFPFHSIRKMAAIAAEAEEYVQEGARLGKPIEFYSCFISYSSNDEAFARKLHADLKGRKISSWFAPDDLKIGDRLHALIDEKIRIYDKLVLILSQHSISSAWVAHEVSIALVREEKERRSVLFPIRLDDSIFETTAQWAWNIKNERHIGDFRDPHDYRTSFERLVGDLKRT